MNGLAAQCAGCCWRHSCRTQGGIPDGRSRSLVLPAAPARAAGWLLALVLLTAVGQAAGINYATKYSLPSSPSTDALAILQHDLPSASGDTDQIVVEATAGSVSSTPVRSGVEAMLAKVQRLPRVASVTSPYGEGGAGQISRDGKIAFATVNFDAQAQDLPAGVRPARQGFRPWVQRTVPAGRGDPQARG
jgi:hypothetical protein